MIQLLRIFMKGEPKSLSLFASGMFFQEIISKVQEHNLRNGFTLIFESSFAS